MDISNEILPKIYLAVIPKYWYNAIPKDIPDSSSTFSLTYDSDEEYEAVKDMEANLNTEDSIVTPEDIPENEALANYLGTYNVEGEPGELTLLNPNRIGNSDVDAVAFHFVLADGEETGTWEKIEDAQIIDGYVWGTVESFSPIAVFTTRVDTYYVDNVEYMNCPGYVANGIPIVVSTNESGKTIVTDAYGKVTQITATTIIIGGSYDRDLESTSVTLRGDIKCAGIRAGSVRDGAAETPLKVGKVKVNIIDVDRTSMGVTGSYGAVRTDEVEINVVNSKIKFCGGGESICNKNDANAADKENASLASKAWVKKVRITLDNSVVANEAYCSGNCGYLYGDDTAITLKNGSEAQWLLACSSNGCTGKASATLIDSKAKFMQTVNRGIVKESELYIKNSEVEYLFPTGDSTDKTVTGIIQKVNKVEINAGSKADLYPGTSGGTVITKDQADEIIKRIEISRNADITYKENAKEILGDVIVIK